MAEGRATQEQLPGEILVSNVKNNCHPERSEGSSGFLPSVEMTHVKVSLNQMLEHYFLDLSNSFGGV